MGGFVIMARGIRLLVMAVAMAAFAPVGSAQKAENPIVVIETTMGNITLELFKDRAPRTVENFLAYAREGFYSDTVFHRVIPGFMIQGGGLTADLTRKETRPPIANEATNGLRNQRGTVAMARTNEVRSATSQFFINTADNPRLDHRGMTPADYGYAVFGRVIDGMDVVDRIEKVKTGNRGGHQNVPVDPVAIAAVRIKS
jgi:cyclophilin family peptidyl-prolyl cis-trans isomerase